MNTPPTIRIALLATLVAFAAGAGARETEPPVKVNTDGLPAHVRVQIEAKAREGQTAVIRYLYRTRNVHNLRPENVIRQEPEDARAGKGGEGERVAKGSEAPRK